MLLRCGWPAWLKIDVHTLCLVAPSLIQEIAQHRDKDVQIYSQPAPLGVMNSNLAAVYLQGVIIGVEYDS
jgi:hypothetical protein